ncbi:hypothetical protein [Nocardia sp. NPDC004711]
MESVSDKLNDYCGFVSSEDLPIRNRMYVLGSFEAANRKGGLIGMVGGYECHPRSLNMALPRLVESHALRRSRMFARVGQCRIASADAETAQVEGDFAGEQLFELLQLFSARGSTGCLFVEQTMHVRRRSLQAGSGSAASDLGTQKVRRRFGNPLKPSTGNPQVSSIVQRDQQRQIPRWKSELYFDV